MSRVNRSEGMVLVIVVAVIAMMSIVVMGMLSRNISRGLSVDTQIKHMQAELLAKGAFWRAYQNNGTVPAGFSETLEGVEYTVTYTAAPAAGPNGTSRIDTEVSY